MIAADVLRARARDYEIKAEHYNERAPVVAGARDAAVSFTMIAVVLHELANALEEREAA